jgi:hypothetical protein
MSNRFVPPLDPERRLIVLTWLVGTNLVVTLLVLWRVLAHEIG